MANQWLRLWHDMPTDPKWRTIARHSKQPISLVQAVYLHLLVDASRNVTRGHATVTTEDLASALDVDDSAIQAVFDAMQGRVMDGMRLSGWDIRQPKREEPSIGESPAKTAAQRKQEQRAREKEAQEQSESRQCHDESRNVTTDKDKDKELLEANASLSSAKPNDLPPCPHKEIIEMFSETLPTLPSPKPELWSGTRAKHLAARWKWVMTARKASGARYAESRAEALDFFKRYFGYVATCPHLLGENGRGWSADLGWLVNESNFAKVLQGNYERQDMPK